MTRFKRRIVEWFRRTFLPPRYYVASFGDYGMQVGFYRSLEAYDEAVLETFRDHNAGRVDAYEHGDIRETW